MTWYKLARPDGFDFYTGKTLNYREAVGSVIHCPDFRSNSFCGYGIHISQNPRDGFVGAKIPCSAFEVEPRTLITIDEKKSKTDSLKVIREITDLDALFGLSYTSLCAFLNSLSHVPWFKPDGDPDPSWKLFAANALDSARSAAWDVARNAAGGHTVNIARNTAWNAVLYAARNAVRSTTMNAVLDAARKAVLNVVRNAASDDTAMNAAWDASLFALLLAISGSPFLKANRNAIISRWRVWEKGYRVLCDVNGVLYVYARS